MAVFCELGKGCVDFPALLRWLPRRSYEGYILVEQDILPGMGAPKESARAQPRIPALHRSQFCLSYRHYSLRRRQRGKVEHTKT